MVGASLVTCVCGQRWKHLACLYMAASLQHGGLETAPEMADLHLCRTESRQKRKFCVSPEKDALNKLSCFGSLKAQ